MRVMILQDAEAVAVAAAELIEAGAARAAGFTLGVSTGSTPLGVWTELVRRQDERGAALADIRAVTLYEYVGVETADPKSFTSTIRAQLIDPLGIDVSRLIAPDGAAPDVAAEARRFEAAIAGVGGVDLQILGIGPNGHLAFNEPTSSLRSRTRAKTLPDSARAGYAGIFGGVELVPFHVLTQGIETILESRQVLLLGLGESRAAAIAASVEGPVSAFWPASALQAHPDVTVLVDEAAASQLRHEKYYRDVLANERRVVLA